jgi:preprotein translocase subunit SecG
MVTFLTIIHILVCLFLILVVLLQAGKGGGMGIAFGGAGSQTVFGSSGAGNFLTRLTSITAAIFLMTSLSLAHYSSQQDSKRLQRLASDRATEKKLDDEKAAKLKADLEKTRAAGGGAASPAPGAPTSAPVPPVTPTMPNLQLKLPGAANAPSDKTGPGAPAAAPVEKKTAPLSRPAAVRKVKPAVKAAPAESPAPADSPAPSPATPPASE